MDRHYLFLLGIVAILGLAAFAFTACKSSTQKGNSLTNETSGNMIKTLNKGEFAQIIAEPDVQLLDVRTAEEYNEGHIDGAKQIDVLNDNFISLATEQLDKSRPVAVYCRSGKRSMQAARQLQDAGFTPIYNLKGGYMSWSN